MFLTAPTQSIGSGAFYSHSLLDGGDAAVLVAPVVSFSQELERLQLASSRFEAVESEHKNYAEQSSDAESEDLQGALKRARITGEKAGKIVLAHRAARAKLNAYLVNKSRSPAPPDEVAVPAPEDSDGSADSVATGPQADKGNSPESSTLGQRLAAVIRAQEEQRQPKFPRIDVPPELPSEFADYLEGALAWHNPAVLNKALAREAWERILDRPKAERQFKSTWAAFMLGRFWETEDPVRAAGYYQQVRQLAREGFADSTGLAAASLGLEARVHLQRQSYEHAIELYLEQLSTGDSSALASLQIAASDALAANSDVLAGLAKNPRTRQVLTAYLLSQHYPSGQMPREHTETAQPRNGLATAWLKAVETAELRDAESVEKFALAAYQNNEMETSERWIKRAPNSPLTQWLQAKLLVRSGELAEAAALLARVVPALALEAESGNRGADWKSGLMVHEDSGEAIPAGRQALGELGVLRLARGEYTQALDALLNAGFWMDGAYVGERVLTLDEFKQYVEACWPAAAAAPAVKSGDEEEASPGSGGGAAAAREQIRYLLARRLTRSLRGAEAREYYPARLVPAYNELAQALGAGWNEALPADQRASALFQAAGLTRNAGLELLGTELAPDWAIHDGESEWGVTREERAKTSGDATAATADELSRAARHGPDPDRRFHYRYQAAALAWEAARLLPNNSDQTAHMLWTGGNWLKNRDPQTADFFYKSLVWRNRNTPLGAEADRQRWFPALDEDGNIIPRRPRHPEASVEPQGADAPEAVVSDVIHIAAEAVATPDEMDPPEDPSDDQVPAATEEYIVQAGDSLAVIVRALSDYGLSITVADLLEANPGLDPTRLRIGQKLVIPGSKE